MPVKAEPVNCKPAIAAKTDLKQEIENIGAAYADGSNKQDAAGMAASFAVLSAFSLLGFLLLSRRLKGWAM